MRKAGAFVAIALATMAMIFLTTKLLHAGFVVAGRCFA
jgi:hypothetical protein